MLFARGGECRAFGVFLPSPSPLPRPALYRNNKSPFFVSKRRILESSVLLVQQITDTAEANRRRTREIRKLRGSKSQKRNKNKITKLETKLNRRLRFRKEKAD